MNPGTELSNRDTPLAGGAAQNEDQHPVGDVRKVSSSAAQVNTIVKSFAEAIEAAGLTPPPNIEADGALHRFSTSNDPHDAAGWYVLHGDGLPAGSFGDWRRGLSSTWHAKPSRSLTRAEYAELDRRAAAAREKAKAEREREHSAAARKAAEIWEAAFCRHSGIRPCVPRLP